ncbi:MAG: DUF6782 family putative metallopeptidase [Pseudomonadota bacterium]|nr:DUF6782 family putative metallopeptidase [Pseudomonadota bacterium]
MTQTDIRWPSPLPFVKPQARLPHPATNDVVLRAVCASLDLAPTGRRLMKECRGVLVRIGPTKTGLTHVIDRGFERITLPEHLAHNQPGMDWMVATMANAMCTIWQHRVHSLRARQMSVRETALVRCFRAADATGWTMRTLWEIKAAGLPGPWNAQGLTVDVDIRDAYTDALRHDPDALDNGMAMASAFDAWFDPSRPRKVMIDRDALDEVMDNNTRRNLHLRNLTAFGRDRTAIEALMSMDGRDYLSLLEDRLNTDQRFAMMSDGLHELANHFETAPTPPADLSINTNL